MANTPDKLLATLKSMPAYDDWFKLAFPGDPAPVTFDNFAKAIEAFEATLLTPASPFDRWLEGDDNAMTDVQKTGLNLFMEKGCSAVIPASTSAVTTTIRSASSSGRAPTSCRPATRAASRSPRRPTTNTSSAPRRCVTSR